MTLIDAAVSRSRTTLLALVLVLVTGFAAYVQIPKEADPDISIPIVYVNLNHEGIGPEDAERLLARPMEIELRSIAGLKQLSAAAYQGGAYLLLEFDAGFDADQALSDVRKQVDKAKPELPEDTDEPSVVEINLSEFPVIVVTLGGVLPERTLLRIARDLEDRLEAIPSVLDAKIGGDRKEVVEIIIDPMLMESYEIDAGHVLRLVARSNTLVAAGQLDTGRGRFAVKVPGLFESVSDILDMPLKVSGDSAITVRDIASVRRTFKDHVTIARVNGKPALSLEISKRAGENIIETTNAVRQAVEAERAHWPPGVEVQFSQDRSGDIRTMLNDLENNVTSAIVLVMVIVVAALGLRSGFLVGIAIPGSFLTGMLVLSTLGLTVNIVVLFSLILAVGMLVDGAIVVTEYADRKMREGELPRHAYVLAARRMNWPIIASTATTLAAFAPLLFWPGIVGEFMKYLPITLLATLSASLLMALVFVPVLGSNLAPVTRGFLVIGTTLAGGVLVGEVEAQVLAMQGERGEFNTIYMLAGNLDNRGTTPRTSSARCRSSLRTGTNGAPPTIFSPRSGSAPPPSPGSWWRPGSSGRDRRSESPSRCSSPRATRSCWRRKRPASPHSSGASPGSRTSRTGNRSPGSSGRSASTASRPRSSGSTWRPSDSSCNSSPGGSRSPTIDPTTATRKSSS